MATTPISWKRGSTFAATVDYTPGAGDPETLAGVTIECSVMDNSQTRYPLTITLLEGDVSFTTLYTGDSSGWAAGTAAIDYKLSNGGVIFYSTTARFVIEPQITF
jgi:hypothetical protein